MRVALHFAFSISTLQLRSLLQPIDDAMRRRFFHAGTTVAAYRCYCPKFDFEVGFEKSLVGPLTRSLRIVDPSNAVTSVGIACKLCGAREHHTCAFAWLREVPKLDPLKALVDSYICYCCRLSLMDPFAPVQQIYSLWGRAPRVRNQSGPSRKANIRLEMEVDREQLKKTNNNGGQFQVRCLSAAPAQMATRVEYPCHATFPPSGAKLWCNCVAKSRKPFQTLPPPPLMKKRKDTPCVLPRDLLTFSPSKNVITIECDFAPDDSGFFVFALARVSSVTSAQLLARVKREQTLPAAEGRALAARILTEADAPRRADSDELEVVSGAHTVQLQCLSTLMRLQTPARGVNCKHVQCFDLEFFLHSPPLWRPRRSSTARAVSSV
eukprot:Polyplicarium_translucidae@DN2587_c0_g2_i5.p1